MKEPSDDLDAKIRNLSQEVPSLPSNFQDRVWCEIRQREPDNIKQDPVAGWLEGTFVASISPMRLLTSYGIAAVIISGFLGMWIGNLALSKSETPEIFRSLQSPPALKIFDL